MTEFGKKFDFHSLSHISHIRSDCLIVLAFAENASKQICVPVACMPPTCWPPVFWVGCASSGVGCIKGMHRGRGGCILDAPSPCVQMRHTCENITFPILHMWAVISMLSSRMCTDWQWPSWILCGGGGDIHPLPYPHPLSTPPPPFTLPLPRCMLEYTPPFGKKWMTDACENITLASRSCYFVGSTDALFWMKRATEKHNTFTVKVSRLLFTVVTLKLHKFTVRM